jgi:hypothetical protein
MQTWVDIKFADGEYRTALGAAQIHELEKKCDAGLGRIYARTLAGRYGSGAGQVLPLEAEYRFSELIEIIRQGLIGGGECVVDGATKKVSSVRANDLLAHYVLDVGNDRMNVAAVWDLAVSILYPLIEGYTPPGEASAGESPAT